MRLMAFENISDPSNLLLNLICMLRLNEVEDNDGLCFFTLSIYGITAKKICSRAEPMT